MFGSILGDLIALVITVVAIIIAYFKWTYQYWARKNVPYLEASIPYGNIAPLMQGKEHTAIIMKRIYDEMKGKGWKFGGFFNILNPSVLFLDLELLKTIMTKDFQYFVDRNTYCNEEDDPLSAHLAFIHGTKWRNLRVKLTPTFTSAKMKTMFHILTECEANLRKKLEEESQKAGPSDIKEIVTRFTTDVIGSTAFGIDCNSLEDGESPFRRNAKKRDAAGKSVKLKRIFAMNFPNLARLFHITLTPKDVEDFYMGLVRETVEYREKNKFRRNDFMQLLIDLKNSDRKEESLTFNEVAAQSFLFFLAGFDTSSTLMSYTLYELGKHQEIQDKLREEIGTVLDKHGGKITYEAIQEMKYLQQVLDESLRKHPPEPQTNRRCVKDYKIPGTDVVIEEGTTVIIPMYAIHHDEEYYPQPDKFDPERFSEDNKNSRHNFSFLPFGEGPRICIGMRFGLMQAKVGIASILRSFKVTLNSKTQEPLKIAAHGLFLSPVGGIWLDLHKLQHG